jgi:hypothetical protein
MSGYLSQNKTTHAGVAVNNWTGDFDCSLCRRKRLPASEFSKKMQERRRGNTDAEVKCKSCVEKGEIEEREAAARKSAAAAAAPTKTSTSSTSSAASTTAEEAQVVCSACARTLPCEAFSKSQLRAGPSKQRCQECVAKATADEAQASEAKRNEALAAAQAELKRAEASGTAMEKLKAASRLSALEGELVTGLKPMKMGGRGRGGRGGGARR